MKKSPLRSESPSNAHSAAQRLREFASHKTAVSTARFFKSGVGEYGEGDLFIGVSVPETRLVVKEFQNLPLIECSKLLRSKIHEDRLLALLILVAQFKRATLVQKKNIYQLYVKNFGQINNWDLVDASAHHIVGAFLCDQDRSILFKMARSQNLWIKRISIIATWHFIRRNEFDETLKISQILLNDSHDLIHKAVGWMLREVGKRKLATEEAFLKIHFKKMPRTMLRYAIEKFPEPKRLRYLKG